MRSKRIYNSSAWILGCYQFACKILRFYYCVHNEPLKNDFILTFCCQIAFMAFVSRRSILCYVFLVWAGILVYYVEP